MRNQVWTSDGRLIQDIEIYEKDGQIMALDHISGRERPASEDEATAFLQERQAQRLSELKQKLSAGALSTSELMELLGLLLERM